MAQPVTIHGELRLPSAVLQYRLPAAVQQWLQAAGVLAPQAEHCRWRLAPEAGGYVLTYEVTVLLTAEEAGT